MWAVWQRLGLGDWFAQIGATRGAKALEHAVFAMAANRLVAPCSKRRLVEWTASDVVMPDGWPAPSPDQYYRALDAVAATKDETETHLYARLCDLANLDLRLVCYDMASTYFEGSTRPSGRFPSRAFGYSRDHRGDRPQIVIGLLAPQTGSRSRIMCFRGTPTTPPPWPPFSPISRNGSRCAGSVWSLTGA